MLVRGDDVELIVLPGAGARLHSLRVRGIELLHRPEDPTMHQRDPFFWGGYVMAPWCNRLAPGPVEVFGRTVNLAPNFDDGSAIHGQVYVAPWDQLADASFAIVGEGGGWPWRYRVEMDYRVSGGRVEIVQRLLNMSDEPMPGGIGIHPWFPTPVEVRINSGLTYGPNEDSFPSPVSVTGDLDLREMAPMRVGVDSTWAEPQDPPLELWWPEHRIRATWRAPHPTLHIVAAYAAQRGAVAIEPETHAPQGLRRLLNDEPGAMALIPAGGYLNLPITIDFDFAT